MTQDSTVLTIDEIGAQGDGVARVADGPVYVPGALPGERWLRAEDGTLSQLTQSDDRVSPPCRHFLECGGCTAQHMSEAVYADWKTHTVRQAFSHRGIDGPVRDLQTISARSRRRANLGVKRTASGIVLGFRREGAHKLVDLETCEVLHPAVVSAFPVLRNLAERILAKQDDGCRVIVTLLDDGLDVAYDADSKGLQASALQSLAQIAARSGIIRLSVGGQQVMARGAVHLTLGLAAVSPPPGVFLQAVPQAEALMVQHVMEAIPKAKTKHVADLFCGLGTFAFHLAKRWRVLAVDSDRNAINTLVQGANGTKGLKPIETKVRNLFQDPLGPRELDGFDAVVFDPPRAGALAQCERLARSKVRTLVAVSCNPATLARDARVLIDGGYKLDRVTPIDQFVYSSHIEAVAVFRR